MHCETGDDYVRLVKTAGTPKMPLALHQPPQFWSESLLRKMLNHFDEDLIIQETAMEL